MAATPLPIITPLGSYPALPITALAANFVFTAGDNVNTNSFVSTGREIVLVTASAPGTVTFTSVADGLNRTGDINAYAVGTGLFAIFGPLLKTGWSNSAGLVIVTPSAATVTFAVIRLPSIA